MKNWNNSKLKLRESSLTVLLSYIYTLWEARAGELRAIRAWQLLGDVNADHLLARLSKWWVNGHVLPRLRADRHHLNSHLLLEGFLLFYRPLHLLNLSWLLSDVRRFLKLRHLIFDVVQWLDRLIHLLEHLLRHVRPLSFAVQEEKHVGNQRPCF